MIRKIQFIHIAVLILSVALATISSAEDRFTDNGDGTVTDHRLNVMWAKIDNQGDIDWNSAVKWVKFTFPDTISTPYDNWRLPTIAELESLYIRDEDHEGYESECGQNVNIVPEIEISCGWLWSSETRSITARVYNFNRGYHYTDRKVHYRAYRALPVRDLVDQ